MSVYKPFLTEDVTVVPFKVNKSFTFNGLTVITSSGIDIFRGTNITSSLWVSGSYPTGYNSKQDEILVYNSIKELYYSNYLLNPSGSPADTASFNPDGTITGDPYTPSYYNYLSTTLPADRVFPTGSGDIIGVYSIPSNLFGEYIKPGTFGLSSGSLYIYDDGEGNLLINSQNVGNIIYEHGMVILTNGGSNTAGGYHYVNYHVSSYGEQSSFSIGTILSNTQLTCSFQSTITIYEAQYKCTIRENEFGFSQNPSLISGSSNSGIISDFATGSYFNPYVTTVGLYNNNKELLAVAKLAQPLPLSDITDTNIMVNLDL